MKRLLAIGLLTAAVAGLLTAWSPEQWAISVPQVAVLALLAMWAVALISGRADLPLTAPLVLPLGFVCWGAVQAGFGWTVYRSQTVDALLYWMTNAAAVVLAWHISGDAETGRFLRKWLFRAGAALALLAALQGLTSGDRAYWLFATPYQDDVWGAFVNRNHYAAFVELLLPVAYTAALGSRGSRWSSILLTAALYAGVVASSSRMGVALATLELAALPLLMLRRRVSWKGVAFAVAPTVALSVVLVAVVGPDRVWERFQERDPYAARRDLAVASLAMLRDRPLTGFGLGTWATVYPSYANVDPGLVANQAHNDWLQAGSEAGVVGLCLLATFWAWSLGTAWQKPWTLGIALVLLHALVDYPLQRQAAAVFFFVWAGLASRAKANAVENVYSL